MGKARKTKTKEKPKGKAVFIRDINPRIYGEFRVLCFREGLRVPQMFEKLVEHYLASRKGKRGQK